MVSSTKFVDSLPPGSTLLWYEIVEVLGKGGFGITYLARDTNLDQRVAIKEYLPKGFAVREKGRTVLPNSPTDTKTFEWGLDRFLKEAQILARFKHPNIVRVMSFFRDSNTAYMVMEYEEGESLDALLKAKKILPEAELVRFVSPLLDGLEELHKKDFIHRDIKPANILVRADGSPVILDFGSARQAIAGQSGEQMTSLLSMGYSPFEQYDSSGNRQGPWSDIYAMGGVLYRAMTGAKPPDAAIRIAARLRNEPDPMKTASEAGQGRYHPSFLQAVDRALMVIETERPQSIAAWRPLLLDCFKSTGNSVSPSIARTATPPAPATTGKSPSPAPKPDTPKTAQGNNVKKNSWRSFIASMNEFGTNTKRMSETKLRPSASTATNTPPRSATVGVPVVKATAAPMPPAPLPSRPISPANDLPPKPIEERKPGDIWEEQVTGMKFVWIPSGSFLMGSAKGAPGRRSDEVPQHLVELDGFWMGQYPVTWGQWKQIMGDPKNLFAPEKKDCPVERILWDDIQELIRGFSRLCQGRVHVRIPTEAEWEYAARAGTTAIFPFGDDPNQLDKYAWFAKNSHGGTQPVGQKQPNVWGLHDMLGNVWEWTSDWYSEDFYSRSPKKNPHGAPFGEGRVRRGGSWRSQVGACRVAHRNRVAVATLSDAMGVRLIRTTEEELLV
ncbi:MAG: SUMF1/EgtB/PvdO family nonheme iron enzyme [Magnetococcales bacterium]|nr:SUMF1/EgtB/PvdO family nonheme iron enzyme [Magnetococcales bacterium]